MWFSWLVHHAPSPFKFIYIMKFSKEKKAQKIKGERRLFLQLHFARNVVDASGFHNAFKTGIHSVAHEQLFLTQLNDL